MPVSRETLLSIYGCKCMLCKGLYPDTELQKHHIIPKYEYKRRGELVDNTIGNLALLCKNCHKKVHQFDCRSSEYIIYTINILEAKVEWNKEPS